MTRKLGINAHLVAGLSEIDALPLIKETGFDCFFSADRNIDSMCALAERGRELGMECCFIHAPFSGINNVWLPGMAYRPVYTGIKQTIDAAAASGVPTIICHLSSGWNAPEITDLGLARFDALVEYAAERNVTIAFENLRMVGNVAYFVDRYRSVPNVGYCYDCGHEHCYTGTVCWPDIFTDQLICTHIHDNHGLPAPRTGDYDTHLLPFDGNFDFQRMMEKLNEYNYQAPLMLEVFIHRQYTGMEPQAFLATAYERLKKIAEMA